MVLTDISQLSAECAEWRQILRNYKEELQDYRKALQDSCRKELSKDQLFEVEHFDNQFHIQLINIHDLKQSIKNHERKVQNETSEGSNASDATFAYHEDLLDQFLLQENTLQKLREDFKNFINATNC